MKKANIRGATWVYEDINPDKKAAILLVHGHPFNHTMWQYQYKALSEYRLILPDLKGYGASDISFEKIYIEEQALDLALLLDYLGIEDIHLLGLSMGGQIIVEFQRLFPHRVRSLVICASLPNAETTESRIARLQLATTIGHIGMLAYTKQDIHKYINLDEVGNNSSIFNHLYNMMSETKVAGAVASHKGRAERRDNYNYLKSVQLPILMIAGADDYFFKVEEMRQLADEIKGAQFEVIEKSGHLPNMEQSRIFNELVTDFYKEWALSK